MNDDPIIPEPVSLGDLGLKYTPGDEPRSVTVQTFRTGKRFGAEAVRAGLQAGKLGRAMEFGFLLYLSDPDEPDVRAVLGRQGDTRFRVYNPGTEQVKWYSIPRTITDTIAIRYSSDPDGYMRITTFGGGHIPDPVVREFHQKFLGVPKAGYTIMSIGAELLRERCFETDFFQRLYSIQAQINADGYETIDQARFKSRGFIKPSCKRLREFQQAARAPEPPINLESFESEVSVSSSGTTGPTTIRFKVGSRSGAIRLSVPALDFSGRARGFVGQTRTFYDVCERAVHEILGTGLHQIGQVDPADLEDDGDLFAKVNSVDSHAAYLGSEVSRRAFFRRLDMTEPPGKWLRHLRALDMLLEADPMVDLEATLGRLGDESPRDLIRLLGICLESPFARVGDRAAAAVRSRYSSLPEPERPAAELAVCRWVIEHGAPNWSFDADHDVVDVGGMPIHLVRTEAALSAALLLRAAGDTHDALLQGWPSKPLGALLRGLITRLGALPPADSAPPAVRVLASGMLDGPWTELRAVLGESVLDADGVWDELQRQLRLPLWPELTLHMDGSRCVLTNAGLGAALMVHVDGRPRGSILPSTSIDVTPGEEGGATVTFARFGKEWTVALVPRPREVNSGSETVMPRPFTLDEARAFRDGIEEGVEFVGESSAVLRIFEQVLILKHYPSWPHIVLTGPSGAGKTTLASVLHRMSPRSKHKFLHIPSTSAASVGDENMMRGEWVGFGANHGVDGVAENKPGFFLLAEGGIVFIDDFEGLPLYVQRLCLSVMEGAPVHKHGGEEVRPNVRLIVATNNDIPTLVARGTLRQDFLNRAAKAIRVPPIVERREDIPLLLKCFLPKDERLSYQARQALQMHDWPGNVREIKQVIDEAVAIRRAKKASRIEAEYLTLLPPEVVLAAQRVSEADAFKGVVQSMIALALESGYGTRGQNRGLQVRVAELLGMDRSNFHNRGKELLGADFARLFEAGSAP